ncbi:site-specific integrase [Methanococcus aeolicus]|uniref:integrase n=1 Tax=Methanococcus aeolicus TaxID=42879 RepID=UPI0021C90C98|nr:integrase [Methanococcus aeolicus]UXM84284.1 integrase [Methanococcus aeolicus]
MDNKKKKGTWDRSLDFDKTYNLFVEEIERIKETGLKYKKDIKSIAYLIIALFQLRNGCRIGEAIEGMIWVCKNKDKINWNKPIEVSVKVEKTKKSIAYRDMYFPSMVKKEDIELIRSVILDLENAKKPRMRIYQWLRNHYGINTHSLRYAFITKFAEMNTSPQLIAKMTGHVNLNHLITYTQEKTANKMLRDLEIHIKR